MRSKYDRPALKLEFFQSDVDEVQEFLRWKFGEKLAKSNMKNKCKWRTSEKQERKNKIVQKALNKQATKESNALQVPIEDLMRWKKEILELLLQQVQIYIAKSKDPKNKKKSVFFVADAERILKMFKTELGEPATIWANYNMNANKVEWLTDEESQALDILFGEKVKKTKMSSK